MNRPGSADDRDDSSKTTPAADLQADDACGPAAQGGQAQGERREPQDPARPQRSEQGPSEARTRAAMKQQGRTGEGR